MTEYPFKCPVCGAELVALAASGVWGRCDYEIFRCDKHGYFVYVSVGGHGSYFKLESWRDNSWNWREVDRILEELECVEDYHNSPNSILYYLKH